jgi:ribosomal protein S18 acetylase RimI-like enzyme
VDVGASQTEHSPDVATSKDVRSVLRLIEEAGWAYTRSEIERLIAVQPRGMLLLRGGGLRHNVLGCVYASAWGKVGFIGLMLVRSTHRGRGLGKELMRAALTHLEEEGTTCVLLDAVVDAVDFYRALGFRTSWRSLRYGIDTKKEELKEDELTAVRASVEHVDMAIEMDKALTGMDRSTLLRMLHANEDSRYLVVQGGNDLLAYGVLRRSKGCMRLGPVVASPRVEDQVAVRAIVSRAMVESYPRMLTMNVPSYNREAIELMVRLGVIEYTPCTRMYLGHPGSAESPEGVWALGAAEKG